MLVASISYIHHKCLYTSLQIDIKFMKIEITAEKFLSFSSKEML